MSGALIDLLLECANRPTGDVADMREGRSRPFRISARASRPRADATRAVDGLREEVAGLRREVASPASEQALLANRVEDAFSRAVHADIRLDDLSDDPRQEGAV